MKIKTKFLSILSEYNYISSDDKTVNEIKIKLIDLFNSHGLSDLRFEAYAKDENFYIVGKRYIDKLAIYGLLHVDDAPDFEFLDDIEV